MLLIVIILAVVWLLARGCSPAETLWIITGCGQVVSAIGRSHCCRADS
jgi:hypothetical protein